MEVVCKRTAISLLGDVVPRGEVGVSPRWGGVWSLGGEGREEDDDFFWRWKEKGRWRKYLHFGGGELYV